jgi:two-component system, OmpR family, response regulator
MSRILVVEDELHLADGLRFNLEADEHEVDLTDTGEDALRTLAENPGRYDLIVLDVMLPGIDGFKVTEELRGRGQYVPVLILTARGRSEDVLAGFGAGADDYLTKPFAFTELFARLRALTRRPLGARPTALQVGDLVLDPATRHVRRGDTEIPLSSKQFAILEQFMRRPGEVITRSDLLEHVWDFAYEGTSNLVDVYVRTLRERIDRPFGVDSIETIRGAGYRLREASS